jgi:TRAP-type C4-dicarboxylate transport system permease small subunit
MHRRQLRLSVVLAIVFIVSVFTVPLLNHAAPDAMLSPVLGIPFVWLYVGVVLHLEFWTIAILYTVLSNRWERALVDEESSVDE